MSQSPTLRIDLHCHSLASYDCRTPLSAILERCEQTHLNVLALTDHNQIWGAVELGRMTEQHPTLKIIVGEEVSTREGELIGLYLQRVIPAGLTPEQTVNEIHAQGGLVLLPHGFDPLKVHRLKPAALERIAADIDIVETFNARISRRSWNTVAERWAHSRGLPMSAGSDAHIGAHIGDAWVQTPQRSIEGAADLLAALRGGQVKGVWTHPVLAFAQKTFGLKPSLSSDKSGVKT